MPMAVDSGEICRMRRFAEGVVGSSRACPPRARHDTGDQGVIWVEIAGDNLALTGLGVPHLNTAEGESCEAMDGLGGVQMAEGGITGDCL